MTTQAEERDERKTIHKKLTRADALKMLKDLGTSPEVIAHCTAVSDLAMRIAKRCKKPVNLELVEIAALLHDIGRSKTHGIRHAVDGAKIARENGLPEEIINIIERHIGAGLTEKDAVRLGLPPKSYMPETLEEKIISHADNLMSGSKKIPVADTVARLVRIGETEGAHRMLALHKELSELCGIDLDQL